MGTEPCQERDNAVFIPGVLLFITVAMYGLDWQLRSAVTVLVYAASSKTRAKVMYVMSVTTLLLAASAAANCCRCKEETTQRVRAPKESTRKRKEHD
jgi:hypothetical protein